MVSGCGGGVPGCSFHFFFPSGLERFYARYSSGPRDFCVVAVGSYRLFGQNCVVAVGSYRLFGQNRVVAIGSYRLFGPRDFRVVAVGSSRLCFLLLM